jgi:hypothetical protein
VRTSGKRADLPDDFARCFIDKGDMVTMRDVDTLAEKIEDHEIPALAAAIVALETFLTKAVGK